MNTNPGWTMQGQWAWGQPTGGGGLSYGNPDPTAGYTGSDVCGVNLGGDYSTTVGGPYYLDHVGDQLQRTDGRSVVVRALAQLRLSALCHRYGGRLQQRQHMDERLCQPVHRHPVTDVVATARLRHLTRWPITSLRSTSAGVTAWRRALIPTPAGTSTTLRSLGYCHHGQPTIRSTSPPATSSPRG